MAIKRRMREADVEQPCIMCNITRIAVITLSSHGEVHVSESGVIQIDEENSSLMASI